MKRTLLLITTIVVLFAQCKRPSIKFPAPAETVSMTITAGQGSKTDISSNTGGIVWGEDDRIYVGDGSKYVGYLTIVSGVGNATGTFTGDLTVATGTHTFHFYYLGGNDYTGSLASGSSTAVEVDFSSQNIYEENGKLKNASGQHVGYGKVEDVEVEADKPIMGLEVSMKSKVAIAYFCFQQGEGETAIPYTGALTLSGEHIYNKMTVRFNAGDFSFSRTKGDISLANTTTHLKYAMLVPTNSTDEETLTFGGDVTGLTKLENGIETNKFYRIDGSMPIVVTVKESTIHVESVSLNKNTMKLLIGDTEKLTATVSPDNATDKSVTWSSSKESVAVVGDDGTVTAVAVGEATITVTTVDGGKTATCTVTVPVSGFSVSDSKTVEFAKGNLWYGSSAFHFENDQWGYSSSWDNSHVSHFYWSKNAGTAYNRTYSSSGATASDVLFTNATETTASPGFQVSGETAGTWRTLSTGEWIYLMDTRSGPTINGVENCRYAEVKVNNVKGLMLFPDKFAWPSEVSSKPTTFNTFSSNWNNVNYSTTDFGKLETAGVIFIPAAGYRTSTMTSAKIEGAGEYGGSWSSSCNGKDNAYRVSFYDNQIYSQSSIGRENGYAVRLVRDK